MAPVIQNTVTVKYPTPVSNFSFNNIVVTDVVSDVFVTDRAETVGCI